jgi:hypothetical protein
MRLLQVRRPDAASRIRPWHPPGKWLGQQKWERGKGKGEGDRSAGIVPCRRNGRSFDDVEPRLNGVDGAGGVELEMGRCVVARWKWESPEKLPEPYRLLVLTYNEVPTVRLMPRLAHLAYRQIKVMLLAPDFNVESLKLYQMLFFRRNYS